MRFGAGHVPRRGHAGGLGLEDCASGPRRRSSVARRDLSSIDSQLLDPGRDPALAAALQALPAKRRLIVFLRYFADLSYGRSQAFAASPKELSAATLTQARSALEASLSEEDGYEGR